MQTRTNIFKKVGKNVRNLGGIFAYTKKILYLCRAFFG